ncbi:carboxypeptidase-like regulatory domain-containing protein [Comamonas antarctica]|uniref:Carboxypeptidase regulatory-like domain-containing protein n=1 Tax=Comamonas antarctica TaxID=2743470 RepID=A0A6N1X696_9BURK|nr:carboxypeptidase-like regulatory domain-containing protein [Comamonas antarctica]QKV54874.1 carboxypeptidase regulatory-like domain-containing protein [Comamonas antarctica]
MRANLQKVLLPGMALVVVAGMAGCYGREQTVETPPAASVFDGPDPNEREAPWSEMNLEHVRSSNSLQHQGGPVQFKASGAVLSTDMSMYTVYVNRSIVDVATLRVDGDMLTVASALKDGINPVSVYGSDAEGALVVFRTAIWAGTASVQGKVVDEPGNPVARATVVAALTEDPTVTATTTTDSAGRYVLNNFPRQTVAVTATGTGTLSGSTIGQAGEDFGDIVFWSFGIPVATPNLDFSRGTEGWISRRGPPPTLADHVENPGPQPASSESPIRSPGAR